MSQVKSGCAVRAVIQEEAAAPAVVKQIRGEPLFTDDRQEPRTRERAMHYVKSWTYLFQAALAGTKTHDIRVLDRDYQVGDVLCMCEYDWGRQVYTGQQLFVEITYITKARPGDPQAPACAFSPTCLHPDYGVLSIRKLAPGEVLQPGTGKAGKDARLDLQHTIASILDHPSVFMGGPSRGNLNKADAILDALGQKGMVNG